MFIRLNFSHVNYFFITLSIFNGGQRLHYHKVGITYHEAEDSTLQLDGQTVEQFAKPDSYKIL